MTTIELLHAELQDIRLDLKEIRKDLHGLMWRFVGISAMSGSVSAAIVVWLHRVV